MSGAVQFACFRRAICLAAWGQLGPACALILSCAIAVNAAAPQNQTSVANIEGTDVSVATPGSAAALGPAAGSSSIVTNGSVVTVHSGEARLMLTSGGEIDVCGPAKFTLLQSGEAITVALDFGALRVQLPLSTNLRVFTPTTIATPLDINGTPRDVTLGLELDDSLCVKAASGALLLENQFSGDKLVVPQAGEFFLAQGKLVPVARPDSKCECTMSDAHLVPSVPPSWSSIATTPVPAHTETPAKPAVPATVTAEPEEDVAKPNVEFSTLSHANEAHPVAPPPRPTLETPPPHPETAPLYKIVMPPLTFSAASPAPPPDNTAETVMLIRSVQVQPEWEFTGHVDAPSLDEPVKNQAAPRVHAHQPKAAGAKPGFWAKVKRFFSGSSS